MKEERIIIYNRTDKLTHRGEYTSFESIYSDATQDDSFEVGFAPLVENGDTAAANAHIYDDDVDVDITESFESRTILLLRLLVVSVLAASTALVAAMAFAVTRQAEREKFEQSFLHSSATLFDTVGRTLYTTLGAVDTFVVSLVVFARHTNQEWPFVTLPNYATQVAKIRARANLACVNQFAVVPGDQRQAWEIYAANHDDWVEDGLLVQRHDVNYHGTTKELPLEQLKSDCILDSNGCFPYQPNRTEPYLPNWQSSPVMPTGSTYNWDFSTIYSNPEYRTEVVDHKKVVMAEVYNVPTSELSDSTGSDTDEEGVDEASKTIIKFIQYLDPNRDPSEPLSDIIYPITRDAPDHVTAEESDDSDVVVGFIITTLFWSNLIKHVLPTGMDGIIFIMENDCKQVFSYQIDGPSVTYLGPGDHHDPIYDNLKQETSFLDMTLSDDASSVVYTGLPLSEKGCPFHLRVYPSKTYEKIFISNDPFIYTLNVLIVFGFVSCLFCAWDSCVERRQKMVVKNMLESSANVCLLEKKVQERTQKIRETNKRLGEANRRLAASSAAQLQTFASMSHEIRTPLNCIIGLSSLLQETELNPSQAESMQMIVSSSDLLLAVVNDVLDYSKLESGKVEVEIRRSNLQEILNSVVFAIETKAEDKDVKLRTLFNANVGSFMNTDGRRLQQILYNLLGNAIKFSTPGSDVELMLKFNEEFEKVKEGSATSYYSPTDEQDRLVIGKGPVIRFSIKNYGNGIPEDNLGKIFEPFRSDSGASGGTGLGLAITTRLVHALRGRISVESTEGEWVMFTVEFPSAYTESADSRILSQRLMKAKVFLVCRQSDVVDQLKDIFRAFSTNLSSFETMVELKQHLATICKQNGTALGAHLICLVDEDLYDRTTCMGLRKSLTQVELSVITFGPKHTTTDARDHFRSLVRLLPSVLIEHLGSYLLSSQIAETPVRDPSFRRSSITGKDADRVSYQDYRVLIAEDNVINQKVLVRMLKRLGLKDIAVVDNGQKAVELEAVKEFDVVLMDMQMPVMDGVEACKLILCRKRGTHPRAKVFFVTAHAAAEFENTCRNAGGIGFLPKPFNIREIEKCFQKLQALFEEEASVLEVRVNGGYGTFDSSAKIKLNG